MSAGPGILQREVRAAAEKAATDNPDVFDDQWAITKNLYDDGSMPRRWLEPGFRKRASGIHRAVKTMAARREIVERKGMFRLNTVRVEITVRYRLPSEKMRRRGHKLYPRESEWIEREKVVLALSHEVLDGYGDVNDQQSKGLVLALREVNRGLWKWAQREGWPRPKAAVPT